MDQTPDKKLLARADQASFVGREAELDRLLSHGKSESSANLVVLAAPRAGASELLRQAYDRLFAANASNIPFYFQIRKSDKTARRAAFRFTYQFLLQAVAFRRHDPAILAASPTLDELAELAAPSDGYWIDRLIRAIGDDRLADPAFIRNCLSAPLRAAANGAPSFVMIDDVHLAGRIDGGRRFLDDLLEIFSTSSRPMVFSGHRRFLYGKLQAEIVDLDPFDFADAGRFVEKLAVSRGVKINDQTRDLIGVQLAGVAGHIASIIGSAAANGDELNNFDDVERVYTDEIFGGHLGRYFDEIVEGTGARPGVLRLLNENMQAGSLSLAYWTRHLQQPEGEFRRIMDSLHHNEIVNISSGSVSIDRENAVVCDYIRARSRLEIDREPRALAVGGTLAENVKRAPVLMARIYRQNAAIGLRDLMESFDGRHVSSMLLDYSRFKQELKGADDERIQKALKEDEDLARLPHIVYTAHTGHLYPPLNQLCDIERSAVGLGFPSRDKKGDIVWLAAEVDSKLEAAADVTEFWCDRLEMAAAHSGFPRFRIWLIAPEGFSPEAMSLLAERNAFGSSRRQVELLTETLGAEVAPAQAPPGEEYEFVVPMGSDTEMLTARAVDDIAKRHDFPAKTANQIKTALVEACINAAEHSLSPDRKIHQKFLVDDDKITITVANRGVRLADKEPYARNEGRRGWGLKLIKGLMDTVEVAETDDGTQVTMVKYLRPR